MLLLAAYWIGAVACDCIEENAGLIAHLLYLMPLGAAALAAAVN